MNYKKCSEVEINKMALNSIEEHDIKLAQKLFEINRKVNYSNKSLNNLGIFYYTEGKYSNVIRTNLIKYRKAEKLLKKACKIEKTFLSLSALANLYLIKGKYIKAEKIYYEAIKIKSTYQVLNNLGVSLYYQKKYIEASEYFLESHKISNKDNKFKTYLPYSYCMYLLKKTKAVDNKIKEIVQDKNTDEIDLIELAYIFDEYDYIKNNYKKLIENYFIDLMVFKIIINTLKRLGLNEEAYNYKEKVIHEIENADVCYSKKDIKLYKKAYEEARNKEEKYTELDYEPFVLFQCNYFGCNIHNNKY